MRTTRKFIMSMLIVGLFAFATFNDLNQATYDAYLSGSQNLWIQAVNKARASNERERTNNSNFKVLLAEYGLLNATMKDQDEDLFDEYINVAFERGEVLVDADYRTADSKAILSALTGLKIAYSPWKGMFLGPKSEKLISEALALDSQSPIVQQLYGNQQNFTPEMWGGDPDKAVKAYQKAIDLYERSGNTHNWMYLDAHAWLGIVFRKQNKPDEARMIWEKAVTIEPDFRWVKNALLPSLENSDDN